MKLKTTSLTLKTKVIPLPIFKMSASGAGLGGVSGIDGLNHDANYFPLILQELSELVESPGVEITPLCFPVFGRLPNSSKVFKRNSRLMVFQGFIHNSLRDTVVGVSLKSLLFTTKAFQSAFCTPRPFHLKALANSPMVMFSILNFTPTKELSSRSNGYKSLPHITANDCGDIFKFRGIDCLGERNIKKHAPLASGEGGSTYVPSISKIFSLVSTKNIGNFNSPLNSRDAYRLSFCDKPEISTPDSTFKKNASRFEDSQVPFATRLHRGIGSSNLPDSRASHLSCEGKAGTNILVGEPMQGEALGEVVILKSYLANIITGLGKLINRLPQCLWGINQLQRHCPSNFTIHQELVYHIFGGKSSLRREVCRNSSIA